jgi:hypothetical protein
MDEAGPSGSGSNTNTTLPKIVDVQDRSRKGRGPKKGSKSHDRIHSLEDVVPVVKLELGKKSKVKRKSRTSLQARSSTKLRAAVSYQSSTKAESGIFLYVDMHGHATKRGKYVIRSSINH